MNLYQIVKKNESYEHWAFDDKVIVPNEVFFIVAKDNHEALTAIVAKTKCRIQDLTINKICRVGEIMGAHFTPVEY